MEPNNKQLFPKVSHIVTATASTNSLAVAAVGSARPPAHGAVFLARDQTAGRGQGGNGWHATPFANLTLSLVCYPTHVVVGQLFALSQVASLAVAATVRAFLPTNLQSRVRVKWPNDIYVGDRKIAGVLIQNGLQGSAVAWTVIGIGLNVNERNFPAELGLTATSLAQLTGADLDLDSVLAELNRSLSTYYAKTAGPQLAKLELEYESQLYRRGLPSEFLHVATGRRFTGVIDSVNDQGQLVVKMVGGRFSAFDLREISLLR